MIFRKGSTKRLTFLNMRKTIFLILILKLGKHEFCNLNAFIFSLR